MRRIITAGAALLFCGVIAARSKTEPLVFVFRGVDRAQDVAILRPMIAPDIAVQLDSGSSKLERGAVLQCQTATREHAAIVEGQISKVSEMILDCDDYKFAVKALDFSQRAGTAIQAKKD